ncbi:unnamed protein product [Heterobilharzia americana]|nr:unnamed protein product [Heterobilharzia americana]
MRHPFNLLLAREQGDIGPSSKSRRLRYRASRWITEGNQRFNGLQIYGFRSKGALYPDAQTFQESVQGSLWAVTRLHLENKFEYHRGCVNTLNFNDKGSLIASGSDDLKVVVTNWITGERVWSYHTGHSMNIFHVKFVPESNDLQIVSCACDSEVRLAQLSPSGGLACPTRLLVKHSRGCHKLSIPNDEPNIVLSAGADGQVFSTDLRIPKSHKLLWLPFSEFFSISSNPIRSYEFALCGRSESIVRIYDRRKIDKRDPSSGLLHSFGADHLRGNRRQPSANGILQMNNRLINSCRRRFHASFDSGSDSGSDSDSNNLLNSLSVQLGRRIRAVLSGLRGRARAALLMGNNDESFLSDPWYNFEITKYSITAGVYSAQGDAILLSYNDEDIYLFDINQPNKPYLHKYSGHRNMQTIVGASFFGPNSEYIVSGSDDGYFYLWDRESEGIVQWLHADTDGAVNVIEPHPTLPVLASAGLDYDFKIWTPLRPFFAEEDKTIDHLKYTSTKIPSAVMQLRKSRLAKAFFPNNNNNNNVDNNTNDTYNINNKDNEMESLSKLLSDKSNGISISIGSSSSSSSSPSNIFISSTSNHIPPNNYDNYQVMQSEVKTVNSIVNEHSTDMNSSLYTVGKCRKRPHPTTDEMTVLSKEFNHLDNDTLECNDNIQLMPISNNTLEHEEYSSCQLNSFECSRNKQPKRSSSPTATESSSSPINQKDVGVQIKKEHSSVLTMKEDSFQTTVDCLSKVTENCQDAHTNGTLLNNERIQPRLPQEFLPFNQIDLQLRVAQNWINRTCENISVDGLDEANFRILSAIQSITEIRGRRRGGLHNNNDNDNEDDDESDSSSSNTSNSSSESNNSQGGIGIVRSVLMLGRRRLRNNNSNNTSNNNNNNNDYNSPVVGRSEETLASRDRDEGSNENSSDDEDGMPSRITSFLAKELNCSSSSSSDSESSISSCSSSTSSSSSSSTSNSSSSSSSFSTSSCTSNTSSLFNSPFV